MANRTTLVDNNTWNNTHIATVGRALASREEDAYPIMESLDVDYVLAVFGGMTGYQSDDVNKFLWPVRIAGGVFPHIKEADYFGAQGGFRVDSGGSETFLNSMLYKMCYYRFDELKVDYSRPGGFDRARNVEIGHKGFELEHLEEAFTSEHWIVRIYAVKRPSYTQPTLSAPSQRRAKRRSTKRKDTAATEETHTVKYVGCYEDEGALGDDRVYGGSSTGAHFGLAKHHAIANKKRFVGIARTGTDGHAFAFNTPPTATKSGSPGCQAPCMDDQSKYCGCADSLCNEPTPAGQDNNRRWAVYELVPKNAKSGGTGKKKKSKKSSRRS